MGEQIRLSEKVLLSRRHKKNVGDETGLGAGAFVRFEHLVLGVRLVWDD